MSSTSLASACAPVSADINIPISLSPQKLQESQSTQPLVCWCFSLYRVSANVGHIHHVRRSNACVLAENHSSLVLPHEWLSKTSFVLFCFKKIFLHDSALAFYLCPFSSMFLPMYALAKHHSTQKTLKNPYVSNSVPSRKSLLYVLH